MPSAQASPISALVHPIVRIAHRHAGGGEPRMVRIGFVRRRAAHAAGLAHASQPSLWQVQVAGLQLRPPPAK